MNDTRCVIYAFWDKDGCVDRYVYKMLEALQQVSDTLLFVANGSLRVSDQRRLIESGIITLKRPNKGMDIWAYKIGMDYFGWDALTEYDEVVLINNSILGPVYPLGDVFESMGEKDVDFWGLSRHPESHLECFKMINDYGYVPEHIQSFFLVFRKRFIESYEFQYYWDHLPMLDSYREAVYRHEVVFTRYFSDMGFSWDTYLHTEEMEYLIENLMHYYPKVLVERYKCPVFKRKVFCDDYKYFLENIAGQSALELYEYLRKRQLYDVDMIWENLLRTCNLHDLFQSMHLNYILPGDMSDRDKIRGLLLQKKTAVIAHIYFLDLLEDTFHYLSQIPDVCDLYITTSSGEVKEAVEERLYYIKCNCIEVRMIPNRGRDVSALLVGVKDIVAKYEYLCFVHDKKTTQVCGCSGESFSYKCFENTLHSEDYIYNIIEKFENNPRLGILCPPEPNHGAFSPTLGLAWGSDENYQISKLLAEEMNITVSIDREKDPIAPYGSFFWFRYDALKAFYDRGWEYEDFPPEPLAVDGTVSHAIERLRSFVAQQAGYYTAYVMNDKFARVEYTNLHTYVENFNKSFFNAGCRDSHYGLLREIEKRFS